MRKSITLLLMAAAIAVFTGCEDDSSGKKDTVLETGNSTIRGNITDTGDIPARAVSAKVAATIPVWLKGTTTETYTDQNGNFIFENIPAGDYTICFEIGGKTYEYPVSVSEGATLIISNLGVSADGTVLVSSVRESTPSNSNTSDAQDEVQEESPSGETPSPSPSDSSLAGIILRPIIRDDGHTATVFRLSPSFSPSVTTYRIENEFQDFDLGFVLSNPDSTMTVNGTTMTSGQMLSYRFTISTHPSGESGISGGNWGPWTVVVTSPDGTTTTTYEITLALFL